MATIDLISALGRLLRDGSLRDALAVNPQAVALQLQVRERDRLVLIQLVPEDLEFQARVLLRKRLDAVRCILPATLYQLDGDAWPAFYQYARTNWPAGNNSIALDAHEFCCYLKRHNPESLCAAEWNRLRFRFSKNWLALHCIHQANSAKKSTPTLQVFFRTSSRRWHEILLHCRL